MQSKRHSVIESLTNTFVGLFLSFAISQLFWLYETQIQIYIWHDFIWHINTSTNVVVTLVLTVVSILRGYVLRRWFNRKTHRQQIKTLQAINSQLDSLGVNYDGFQSIERQQVIDALKKNGKTMKCSARGGLTKASNDEAGKAADKAMIKFGKAIKSLVGR